MFFSKSFIVSGLTFRSLIHFELTFVYSVRKCSNFILLHVVVHFSQQHLLKKLCFLYILLPLLSQVNHRFVGLFLGFPSYSINQFLCQYHTVLITITMQYSLKSGSLIPPALFLLPSIVLVIWGILCFHTNSNFFLLSFSWWRISEMVSSYVYAFLILHITLITSYFTPVSKKLQWKMKSILKPYKHKEFKFMET